MAIQVSGCSHHDSNFNKIDNLANEMQEK